MYVRIGLCPVTSDWIPAIMDRPTYEEYWMSIAEKTAERSTCSHLNVGAILVKENRLLSTGYNGTAKGETHCNHKETEQTRLSEPTCNNTIHAEVNCLVQCDQPKYGSEMFCTHVPCYQCAGLIINAGVLVVHFRKPYRIMDGVSRLANANVFVSRM